MPSIARNFVQLARSLGRVGTPASGSMSASTELRPTLDADQYDPLPWYGVGNNNTPVVGEFAEMFVEVPEGVTITDVWAGLIASNPVNFGRAAFVGAAPSIAPVRLTSALPSRCDTDVFSSATQTVLPLSSPRLFPILAAGAPWIPLAPVVGPSRLHFEATVVSLPVNLSVIWREVVRL